METLLQEFEPIALEMNQFETRHTKNVNRKFSHVQPIKIPTKETQLESFS